MSTISSRDGRPRESRSSAAIRMPGRAEAALERVVALERVLQRREHRVAGERLDRLHRRAVGLDREQAAAADRDAVEPHGAGAADAVLAADVRAGEAEAVAEEVGQEQARLDVLDDDLAVDRDRDLASRGPLPGPQQRPLDERAGEVAEVRGGGVDRAGRVDRPSGEQAGLARRRLRQRRRLRPPARPRRARSAGRSPRRPTPARRGPRRRRAGARPPPSRARSPRPAARAPRTRRPRPAPARGQVVATTSSPGASVVR